VRLLVVNAGSSSLKLRVLDPRDRTLADEDLEWPPDAPFPVAALERMPEVDAVAHRVVHGGAEFRAATWIDGGVRARLEQLTALAPLHQPRALAAIDACGEALPGKPAAAGFDTAFHATLPPAASTYALPAAWNQRWGLRRYGFHGLSHAYASRRAAELAGGDVDELRIVSCHLGAGASLAAVAGGRSVDTTMGFTPLEGLVMASRAGTVDPGLLVWLLQRGELELDDLADGLEHHSGLAGLAGTRDMREIGGMVASAGGLDVLVFTGGIGEHAPAIRAAAADGLRFLGVQLDAQRNAGARRDADISETGAHVCTLVVTAREDLEIARQVRGLD
jgi:acetate kinase